jgi:8-hydroxy-5-deazaflavin:NADPH oxidoreductase
MKTIGIIGAGEVGSHIAMAAIRTGHRVVIANSRGPETLGRLIDQLGPQAQAATATDAARAGDFVVVAVPLKRENNMPAAELAGKVVIDTNNYMAWRDGHFPIVDSYEKTEHELRQEQLPASKIVKAFTRIQAPRILKWGRKAGDPDRLALAASSDFPEAIDGVRKLNDQYRFRYGGVGPAPRVLAHHTRTARLEAGTPKRRGPFSQPGEGKSCRPAINNGSPDTPPRNHLGRYRSRVEYPVRG